MFHKTIWASVSESNPYYNEGPDQYAHYKEKNMHFFFEVTLLDSCWILVRTLAQYYFCINYISIGLINSLYSFEILLTTFEQTDILPSKQIPIFLILYPNSRINMFFCWFFLSKNLVRHMFDWDLSTCDFVHVLFVYRPLSIISNKNLRMIWPMFDWYLSNCKLAHFLSFLPRIFHKMKLKPSKIRGLMFRTIGRLISILFTLLCSMPYHYKQLFDLYCDIA